MEVKYVSKGDDTCTNILKQLHKNKTNSSLKERYYVYALFQGEEIVYVGQSTTPMVRLQAHKRCKEYDGYSVVEVSSKEEMERIEARLIFALLPKYNEDIPLKDIVNLKTLRKTILRHNPQARRATYYVAQLRKDMTKLGVPYVDFKGNVYVVQEVAEQILNIAIGDVKGIGLYAMITKEEEK